MTNPAVIILLAEDILSIDGSFLLILFLLICLIFVLNATLFRPINKILAERERLGEGRLSEAQQLLARYDERLRGYESQVRAARAEAYQALESQRREALDARQALVSQVRAETVAQIGAAKSDIAGQVDAARVKLEQDACDMAATISSGILQRPINQ
ncbi:MAG: ATP synthase F0 subunit B [Blastocatellia bacterium]